MADIGQSHQTRQEIYAGLEVELGKPVVTLFTSFVNAAPLADADADMLEGVLQNMDLSEGFVLAINSPGGSGLAAERIINICRGYSGTGEYQAFVPNKAKSAATMVCLGASQIFMGPSSELGPVDPQLTDAQTGQWFSVYNLVQSYDDLFKRAVEANGNLEPYIQQLGRYDEREIQELRQELALSEDIATRTLAKGMMAGISESDIGEQIKVFLTPERTKTHGRPIYRDEALECGLAIKPVEVKERLWELAFELYLRANVYVSTNVTKCVETKDHAFFA
ncbi:SDH family Clp fold serine proteinase [Rubrobacter tropicus]|nr:hypothetical protein [Rubrobacter tropicus]